MAFRNLGMGHITKFNSDTSAKFLSAYQVYVEECIRKDSSKVSSKTIAPSSMRCDRLSWFRLRGVEPDKFNLVDTVLDFSAKIGTACHRIIQSNLKDMLKDGWVDVESYLQSIQDYPFKYSIEQSDDSLESKIAIEDPPIHFACDGILRLQDTYYLLEIKTSEFNSWDKLEEPKPEHIDQIKCYGSLLYLNKALVLYQERLYGGFKCFEVDITEEDRQKVFERFRYIIYMYEHQLAPEGLPQGDKWCTPSMCPYYTKCKEYGK